MLGYKVVRPITILSLGIVFCLVMICAAAAQEIDSWSASGPIPPDEVYVAQQPANAPPPPPAPPAPPVGPPVAPPAGAAQAPAAAAAAPDRAPPPPPRRPSSRFDLTSMLAARSPLARLASMPNMFGDSIGLGEQIYDFDYENNNGYGILVDVPPAGGSRHVKIAENNKALPMDRVYFEYHHFQNALQSGGPWGRTFSIDRYTLGLEKTFRDGLWSAEFRMPFGGAYSYTVPGLGVEGAEVGNLAITLKRLLYSTSSTSVAGGLGIGVPTGGDITGQTWGGDYALYNDAVHLSPWLGFLRAPNDRLFYQGFLQVDVATNGNRVDLDGSRIGTLCDQTLMFVDLETGYWLYRDPYARCLNGLASILELHYTTTLQDADVVSGSDGFQSLTFTNMYNRVDVLNLTVGLHAEMGKTALGVGAVFPLSTSTNRTFDAEVQMFLNRQF